MKAMIQIFQFIFYFHRGENDLSRNVAFLNCLFICLLNTQRDLSPTQDDFIQAKLFT